MVNDDRSSTLSTSCSRNSTQANTSQSIYWPPVADLIVPAGDVEVICCIALLPCFATLCSCLAFLPCVSVLPCCLALACLCYFAWLSTFAALLPVVPCPALRSALPCLALPCAMDVKPTWANMTTLAYRVDNVDLNPKIIKLGGPGRDVAFACTRPGCRARRPLPLG